MSCVQKLIFIILLHLINSRPQVNLDRTNWKSSNENDIINQHDCLHVPATIISENHAQQIVSYCMSDWPTQWNIEEYHFNQKFTFNQLAKKGITSKQLYSWSAPMDIIEDYQSYLNEVSTSKKLSSQSNQIFYNCTAPTFGPLCQYSLDDYESSHLSLQNIIYDYYLHPSTTVIITCYTHLVCDFGLSTLCLDWRNVCDGRIDCIDDGVDEKDCWQLQINECNDDEYRCENGQCIPKTFLTGTNVVFDCLESPRVHDQILTDYLSHKPKEPTITNEDAQCLKYIPVELAFINACQMGNQKHIIEDMFSIRSNSTSDDCWYAFRCCFAIPNTNHPACNDLFELETCQNIINRTCPDMLFIPNIPIHFGHIYLVYTKEDVLQSETWILQPSYICYNDQLCGNFLPGKTLIPFNNKTCRKPEDFPVRFSKEGRGNWMTTYVLPIYEQLYKCNTIPKSLAGICNSSYTYQCIHSSKCISNHRIGDNLIDCDYGDDENEDTINRVCLIDRSGTFFKCTTANKCIHRRLVEDGYCHCPINQYGMCDDENFNVHYITKHISFPTICNGFTELIPINVNGTYETDETECYLWYCNNSYTRCDGYWNCPNGEDEIDCPSSLVSNCSSQHTCLSPATCEFICLPLSKVNNGYMDCLGNADEPYLSRLNNGKNNETIFRCPLECKSYVCTSSQYRYDNIEYYTSGIVDGFRIRNQNITIADKCRNVDQAFYSAIYNFLTHESEKFKKITEQFFSLNGIEQSTGYTNTTDTEPPQTEPRSRYCQRGFPIRIWLNQAENLTNLTCLCPPSYYGNTCQYQNQRVSLTLKVQAASDSRQTLFAIVILFIDNDNQRTIHSSEQFTYLYIRDCKIKFNIYLLYSTRLKNDSKHYSIHIDIYEKKSLNYRGSFLLPVKFLFLPIQRVAAQINITRADQSFETCSKQLCRYGQCIKYSNALINTTSFCRCDSGWSGQNCDISYTHTCSSDSLPIGVGVDNRSICVCPINKFGSRCLLYNDICQSNDTCYNNGECIPIDENKALEKTFYCICPKSFTGDQCEISNRKILITFHENITLPQTMIIHFIQVRSNDVPDNGSTFTAISIKKKSAIIYWSNPYHIAFAKLFENDYYLITVQNTYNKSEVTVSRTINPSDRCAHIREVFNESIVQLHLIRRIKYYHLPCQNISTNLSCFYDDTYFCLCTYFGQQRLANCFEFNSTQNLDCFGQSACLNDGQCLQDKPHCPLISVCMCPKCFYGAQCQFNTKGFGLILDGILGYHIQPHVRLTEQPAIVQISVAFTVIIILASFIDGTLSTITFNSSSLKKIGCGLYLLSSSITTLLFTIIFLLKFTILITAQIYYLSNRSFLNVQCISIDFILRSGLNMNNWLNACVAIERAVTAIKGTRFNQPKSKRIAKYVIPSLLLFIMISNIYDPLHRKLIDDNDDNEQKRIWCVVNYSSALKIYHSFINIFHFFVPFIINIVSTIVIILITTRQQKRLNKNERYQIILRQQIQRHKHILISPFILVILAIPRLILSFVSGCMKSNDDAWLFLIGYFISFIPSMSTFVAFVLPSATYKKEFRSAIDKYRKQIQTGLRISGQRSN